MSREYLQTIGEVLKQTVLAVYGKFFDSLFLLFGAVSASWIIEAILLTSSTNEFDSARVITDVQTARIITVSGVLLLYSLSRLEWIRHIWKLNVDFYVIFWCILLLTAKIALNSSDDVVNLSQSTNFLFVFSVCIVAPVCEEIFFRGWIWNRYERNGYKSSVILLSTSIMFVFIHLNFNLLQMLQLFAMGLCYGLTRMYSGGLPVPIILHSSANCVAVFAIGRDIINL